MDLILVRGVSGSGKTTVADLLGNLEGYVTVAADDFWGEDYNFVVTLLHQAHLWCQMTTINHLLEGKSVVVHNTATTEKDVEVYQRIASEYGARFISLIVENRHGNDSVHNVPPAVRLGQERKLRSSIKLI